MLTAIYYFTIEGRNAHDQTKLLIQIETSIAVGLEKGTQECKEKAARIAADGIEATLRLCMAKGANWYEIPSYSSMIDVPDGNYDMRFKAYMNRYPRVIHPDDIEMLDKNNAPLLEFGFAEAD